MRLFSLVNSHYITFFFSLSSAYPSFPIHLLSESNGSESILHIPEQMPGLSDRYSLPAEIHLEQDPETPNTVAISFKDGLHCVLINLSPFIKKSSSINWNRLPVYKDIAG